MVLPVLAVLVGLPAASPAASPPFEPGFLSVAQSHAAFYRGPYGEVGLIDANPGPVDQVLGHRHHWPAGLALDPQREGSWKHGPKRPHNLGVAGRADHRSGVPKGSEHRPRRS